MIRGQEHRGLIEQPSLRVSVGAFAGRLVARDGDRPAIKLRRLLGLRGLRHERPHSQHARIGNRPFGEVVGALHVGDGTRIGQPALLVEHTRQPDQGVPPQRQMGFNARFDERQMLVQQVGPFEVPQHLLVGIRRDGGVHVKPAGRQGHCRLQLEVVLPVGFQASQMTGQGQPFRIGVDGLRILTGLLSQGGQRVEDSGGSILQSRRSSPLQCESLVKF